MSRIRPLPLEAALVPVYGKKHIESEEPDLEDQRARYFYDPWQVV